MTSPLVLLGAGASRPAGVPTAFEMTQKMLEFAKGTPKPQIDRALNVICGALQTHLAARSGGRSYLPDIERVLDAAQQLSDRDELELTPFVGTWHPAIEALETPAPSWFEAHRIASRASSELFPSENLERVLRSVVEQMIELFSRPPSGELFGELADFMRGCLVKLTWLPSTDKLAYLDPLLALGAARKTTIATLNYDNTIELRAAEKSIPCSTGLAEWNSTGSLPSISTGVDLIKLHGSVNWFWEGSPQWRGASTAAYHQRILAEATAADMTEIVEKGAWPGDVGNRLGLIFGGRTSLQRKARSSTS